MNKNKQNPTVCTMHGRMKHVWRPGITSLPRTTPTTTHTLHHQFKLQHKLTHTWHPRHHRLLYHGHSRPYLNAHGAQYAQDHTEICCGCGCVVVFCVDLSVGVFVIMWLIILIHQQGRLCYIWQKSAKYHVPSITSHGICMMNTYRAYWNLLWVWVCGGILCRCG